MEADFGWKSTQWVAFLLFCWSSEDGYRSQDGDEEGERAGELHGD